MAAVQPTLKATGRDLFGFRPRAEDLISSTCFVEVLSSGRSYSSTASEIATRGDADDVESRKPTERSETMYTIEKKRRRTMTLTNSKRSH